MLGNLFIRRTHSKKTRMNLHLLLFQKSKIVIGQSKSSIALLTERRALCSRIRNQENVEAKSEDDERERLNETSPELLYPQQWELLTNEINERRSRMYLGITFKSI